MYDEAYYEDPLTPGYAGYGAAEARKRHHGRTLLNAIEAHAAPGTLLEIGCAYGYFLDEARMRGWRVRGVEPSEHAARHARERLGLEVAAGPLGRRAPGQAAVDVVALWDVIEHLPSPRETVESLCTWLRPGGVLALSTGDVGSLTARLHGADWSLMTPPWHQFYFSRTTLRRLLEQSGFEVLRVWGDGTLGIDPGSRRPRVPARLGGLLGRPSVVRVARRLGAGAIVFVVARRSAP